MIDRYIDRVTDPLIDSFLTSQLNQVLFNFEPILYNIYLTRKNNNIFYIYDEN